MAVHFSNNFLAAGDRHESARIFATLLGREAPTECGTFSTVSLDGGVLTASGRRAGRRMAKLDDLRYVQFGKPCQMRTLLVAKGSITLGR